MGWLVALAAALLLAAAVPQIQARPARPTGFARHAGATAAWADELAAIRAQLPVNTPETRAARRAAQPFVLEASSTGWPA